MPLDVTSRPRYHFTPPSNFMNDPNGLVYFDDEHHLFYQHNPFGDTWGHMSWGHAVSRDLVHWEHLPVALAEEDGIMIYSGSAVVDWGNTSGFGDGVTPPLVAAYTGHAEHEETQHIAYSTNRGRTWTKYARNPTIAIGEKDFRDPKLFWHAPAQRWIMVCALATQHKVRFYASPNLREWQQLSDFGPAGMAEGNWECPDFFPLAVAGDVSRVKWVLKVDDSRGIDGGAGAQYFVGDFDGATFACDDPPDRVRAIDFGKDFYATQSWSDAPDGRRIWLAWMSNWDYANQTPTSPWRGMMTIPREVRLKSLADGVHLVQQPVVELQQLRSQHWQFRDLSIDETNARLAETNVSGAALEIIAEFEARDTNEFGLKVRVGSTEETQVGYDSVEQEVFVDRSHSGNVSFSPRFDHRHAARVSPDRGRIKLHVFVDACSVEVFADEGRIVLSELIYPQDASDGLALFGLGDDDVRVKSLDVWTLRDLVQG